MALILQLSSSSFIANKKSQDHLLHHRARCTNLCAKSEDSSPAQTTEDAVAAASTVVPPQKKPGLGFGPSTSTKKQKGKRERASVIRRAPIEKPKFASQPDKAQGQELKRNESAFLLAWLGLGAVILVEGLVLAASGFVPEQWDSLFVKYLYPTFTPTVALFVAGTVAYGVLKYVQNEKFKSEN